MEVVQNDTLLSFISSWLERNLPESIIVYNILHLIRDGNLPFFKIWLDNLENPTTIVMGTDREKCKTPFYNRRLYIYTTCQKDKEKIEVMLYSPGVFDTRENTLLHSMQEETAKTVQSIPMSIGQIGEGTRKETYTYRICEKDTLLHCVLPVGYKCSTFTPELLDHTKFKQSFTDETKREGVREALKLGNPGMCVYDEKGNPAAWALQKTYGFLGELFTVYDQRRKGLGQYVFAAMTKFILAKYGQVFTSVHKDNFASIKLHEKIGYKRCPDSMNYVWIAYSSDKP